MDTCLQCKISHCMCVCDCVCVCVATCVCVSGTAMQNLVEHTSALWWGDGVISPLVFIVCSGLASPFTPQVDQPSAVPVVPA